MTKLLFFTLFNEQLLPIGFESQQLNGGTKAALNNTVELTTEVISNGC